MCPPLKADELAAFRREKLGFIFQDYNLLNQMNICENLTLPSLLPERKRRTVEEGTGTGWGLPY